MSNNRRRNRGLEFGVILLVTELFKLGFDSIPPVTLVTVIGQILLYVGLVDVPWDKYDVCISGNKVWYGKDWKSLLLSTFEHGDDMHLYYNMVSFLVKGRSLELKHGTANFALLLTSLCVLTPILYVALALVGANTLDDQSMMKSCAIGFSGVIFALKLITTVESDGYSHVAGVRVPVKYSSWVELIAIHLLVPNASFMGHLAGIIAGLLYMKSPVGTVIDLIIASITGRRMRHSRDSGYSQSSSSSTFNSRRENHYGDRYTHHYPPNDYGYDTRPTAPPGWRF